MTASPLLQIELAGSPSQRARAFARAARPRRGGLLAAVEERLRPLEPHLPAFRPDIGRVEDVLARLRPGILEAMRALEAEADIPYPRLLAYALASYLEDRLGLGVRADGCTTWAAAPPRTSGAIYLAKNRDYRLRHLPLQAVARVRPRGARAYLTLTSLGSPGVFSSGMNEAGLAVADSRVRSADQAPGLPVYALCEILLERCHRVEEALALLHELPRLGGSNLVLADAAGTLALAELGHRRLGVVRPADGLVVNTNHYASPALSRFTTGPPSEVRDSRNRRRRLRRWLLARAARLDDEAALRLMSSHRGREAFCRHETSGSGATISTALYRPALGTATVVAGQPCRGQPVRLSLPQGQRAAGSAAGRADRVT